ncbi:MAG: hypothetical protein CBC63_01155 [Euryarchaeota archaeon TMED103]|nr:MAG: hypothetical protein CBC63_01155 [Euryarchaeota archaeon TMED103]|tara:strand:- start:6987 stop:7994 length:1008 start_codon:yes stop_codon:yes gene_type:complete
MEDLVRRIMPRSLRIDPSLRNIDLSGKRYVITGGSSGSGQATVEFLAKQGAEVITTGRDLARGRQNFESLPLAVQGRITLLHLDLENMESVEKFAAEVNKKWQSFDALVNNAGGALTKNGTFELNGKTYDKQFVGNHIGVFHLSNLLLPGLEANDGARLINVSSVMHDQAKGLQSTQAQIHWDDIHARKRKFDGFDQYAQSKLANLLHAKSLARKYDKDNIAVFPVHPGTISKGSRFGRSMGPLMRAMMVPLSILMGPIMRPITKEDGAQTTLHCLLSEEALNHHGVYHAQTGLKHSDGVRGGWPYRSANPLSHDEAAQDQLWSLSEELVAELKA